MAQLYGMCRDLHERRFQHHPRVIAACFEPMISLGKDTYQLTRPLAKVICSPPLCQTVSPSRSLVTSAVMLSLAGELQAVLLGC